jgi:hypothetical protein
VGPEKPVHVSDRSRDRPSASGPSPDCGRGSFDGRAGTGEGRVRLPHKPERAACGGILGHTGVCRGGSGQHGADSRTGAQDMPRPSEHRNPQGRHWRAENPRSWLVPKAGIEPARGSAPLDFESSASTNSTTSARACSASENESLHSQRSNTRRKWSDGGRVRPPPPIPHQRPLPPLPRAPNLPCLPAHW